MSLAVLAPFVFQGFLSSRSTIRLLPPFLRIAQRIEQPTLNPELLIEIVIEGQAELFGYATFRGLHLIVEAFRAGRNINMQRHPVQRRQTSRGKALSNVCVQPIHIEW